MSIPLLYDLFTADEDDSLIALLQFLKRFFPLYFYELNCLICSPIKYSQINPSPLVQASAGRRVQELLQEKKSGWQDGSR